MRTLVLQHDREPMMVSLTAGPIQARILEWPDDDADLFSVWEAPVDYSHLQPADITEQFAETWAIEFAFGDGIEPHDYLSPFPAFIRAVAEDHLIRKWQAHMARRDQSFVPDPLRRIA